MSTFKRTGTALAVAITMNTMAGAVWAPRPAAGNISDAVATFAVQGGEVQGRCLARQRFVGPPEAGGARQEGDAGAGRCP